MIFELKYPKYTQLKKTINKIAIKILVSFLFYMQFPCKVPNQIMSICAASHCQCIQMYIELSSATNTIWHYQAVPIQIS